MASLASCLHQDAAFDDVTAGDRVRVEEVGGEGERRERRLSRIQAAKDELRKDRSALLSCLSFASREVVKQCKKPDEPTLLEAASRNKSPPAKADFVSRTSTFLRRLMLTVWVVLGKLTRIS